MTDIVEDKDAEIEALRAEVEQTQRQLRETAHKATTLAAANARLREAQEALEYITRENGDGSRPTILDLCYTAFMTAKRKNTEDGGPTDWFTDTRPNVAAFVENLRRAALQGDGS